MRWGRRLGLGCGPVSSLGFDFGPSRQEDELPVSNNIITFMSISILTFQVDCPPIF
jgi:hypothetical protein